MSRAVRTWLLLGCAAIAALEARHAGESLRAGLSGPYALDASASVYSAELSAPDAPSPIPPILSLGPAHAPVLGWPARGGR
jgi:hypothetical protein